MALRVGTPEWADSLFRGRDRGLRVPLPAAQYEFDGFPEAVSLVYTRELAGLSVLPDHGRLELPKRPLLPSLVRHSLCSRADLTALDR